MPCNVVDIGSYLLDGKKASKSEKVMQGVADLMRGIIREQKVVEDERLETWMKFQVCFPPNRFLIFVTLLIIFFVHLHEGHLQQRFNLWNYKKW